MERKNELDIIIPISIDIDWPTVESTVSDILEQNRKYGFTRFALAGPGAGWRGIGYPPNDFFVEMAEMFLSVKNQLLPYGIECGWWLTATLKSGLSPDFTPIMRTDGTEHPFANCPLDPAFRRRMATNVATFSKIGKPAFIFTEDDYSIHAAGGQYGCFCKHHLAEFARREGREYTREELIAIFDSMTKEGFDLLLRWRELARDSLVGLAEEVRRELDIDSPEIAMGYMQAGPCDFDGDCTLAVSRAMAGPRHTPFSRLFGCFYCGLNAEDIPARMIHPVYSKQHIDGDFIFYHESDSFPHSRFFTSGKEMLTIMSAMYSFGYDGSIFQTQQLLDCPNEDGAYGEAFKRERRRLNALYPLVKNCTQIGAEVSYHPFWNTIYQRDGAPFWTKVLGMFSIPWGTVTSDVVFLDKRNAEFYDDAVIMDYLSRPLLFLDSDAADILCKRGYGRYIGVSISDPINSLPENSMLTWDLGSREIITDGFAEEHKGRHMTSAHMLARTNGVMRKMIIEDVDCDVITEMYTYDKRLVGPSMTRFKNSLGGVVVVMGITLDKNHSQSLYNYRRQRLIHSLITEHSDTLAFVREAPRVYVIMNEAKTPCDFKHILTLINLSSDALYNAQIHLPEKCKNFANAYTLGLDGEWLPLGYTRTDDGITLDDPLQYLEPMFIMLV